MEKKFLGSTGLNKLVAKLFEVFAKVGHTHTKSQITDFPTVPSNTSQLTNDSGFITADEAKTIITVDTELSSSSVNPVQNKTITNRIGELSDMIGSKPVVEQISAAVSAIDFPVDSINGKTGAVELTASDIGAVSNDTFMQESSKHITINIDDANSGEPNSINADKLGGYDANEYVKKSEINIEINYSIVASLDEPENPKENMIWIQTEDMNGYVLSKNEPKNPSEGFVWISLGDSGSVSFHTLKIGNAEVSEVFPLLAKQYISSTWVDVTAMSYQGDVWVEWVTALYLPGGYIGEWIGKASWISSSDYLSVPTISYSDGLLKIQNSNNYRGTVYNDTLINFADKKKIVVEWDIDGSEGSTYAVVVVPDMTTHPYTPLASLGGGVLTAGYEKQELDVSELGDVDAYVAVRAYGKTNGTITVKIRKLTVT